MPTMPSPYSFSTWQTPEGARAEWHRDRKHCSLQRPSLDSLRRQTSGDSQNLKRKLLSKFSWLAVLFTYKFSQSTWGDFCWKKKGSGYKQNLPCLLALSKHNLVGWPGVSCRFCVLTTFLKTGRKFRKLSLYMYCHAAFSYILFCQKLYMQIRSNFFFSAHWFSLKHYNWIGG